ncbi:hypothetical protein SAY86_000351 [Trapa natans]|uniref:MIP18 family-like domain-containing protein n=1 Tax=Trapa natans TaxID=22666 RepID=A0AAN7N194_TRANT|nr:hypothetical protein SAY86_000351 [Trapa natans]
MGDKAVKSGNLFVSFNPISIGFCVPSYYLGLASSTRRLPPPPIPIFCGRLTSHFRSSVPPLNISFRIGCLRLRPLLPRDIKDPEHPYSLEELKVISEDAIEIDDSNSYVRVTFTPTVEHCSMATIIGLCLRVKLMRSLPSKYKVDIRVAPGSHATEAAGLLIALLNPISF